LVLNGNMKCSWILNLLVFVLEFLPSPLLVFRTVRNKFLLFISHSICSIFF
jgi:hypothetical protein